MDLRLICRTKKWEQILPCQQQTCIPRRWIRWDSGCIWGCLVEETCAGFGSQATTLYSLLWTWHKRYTRRRDDCLYDLEISSTMLEHFVQSVAMQSRWVWIPPAPKKSRWEKWSEKKWIRKEVLILKWRFLEVFWLVCKILGSRKGRIEGFWDSTHVGWAYTPFAAVDPVAEFAQNDWFL